MQCSLTAHTWRRIKYTTDLNIGGDTEYTCQSCLHFDSVPLSDHYLTVGRSNEVKKCIIPLQMGENLEVKGELCRMVALSYLSPNCPGGCLWNCMLKKKIDVYIQVLWCEEALRYSGYFSCVFL